MKKKLSMKIANQTLLSKRTVIRKSRATVRMKKTALSPRVPLHLPAQMFAGGSAAEKLIDEHLIFASSPPYPFGLDKSLRVIRGANFNVVPGLCRFCF